MKTALTLIIALISIAALGQNHFVGCKGGVNWGNETGHNFFGKTKPATRLLLGVDYAYRFKNNLKIGADLVYSQTGFELPLIFTDETGNPLDKDPVYTQYHFDYLTIPLKVGYEYGTKGFVYGNIGVASSFLLSARNITPAIAEYSIPETEYDVADQVAPLELGGIIEIGVGYTFFEKLGVFAEGNFYHAFTSLTTDDYYSQGTIFNYRTSAILGVRYSID